MNLITTMEHVYAVAISDAKKAGKFIETQVLPVLKTAHADAATIEAVTAIVSPQLANLERVGDAVLGVVIKAIEDAGTAAGASGISVAFDAQFVADVKAILPVVHQARLTSLLSVPV